MKKLLVVSILLISMSSCLDQERLGVNSLKGNWTVVSINSNYAIITESGGHGGTLEAVDESGNLGSFNFQDKLVEFNFTRNDTAYVGTSEWKLNASKKRSGFSRVTEFSLDIKDEFIFEVRFEDETRNSAKKATYITLSQQPTEPGFGVYVELILEKN